MKQPYHKYWGKANRANTTGDYHLLPYHSLDVAAVGDVMLSENPKLLHKFSQAIGIPAELFQPLFVFFLAIHDLGKFAEAFQGQDGLQELYLQLNKKPRTKQYAIRHDSLGYMLWERYFLDEEGEGKISDNKLFLSESKSGRKLQKILEKLIEITTGHHGKPPFRNKTVNLKAHFSQENIEDSFAFLQDCYTLFSLDKVLCSHQSIDYKQVAKNIKRHSYWLAGFTVLCDWIGSNNIVFTYEAQPMTLAKYWQECAKPLAMQAIQQAGVLPSTLSQASKATDLFSYLKKPTPLQQESIELPLKQEPSLIILEDVTGAGKTEASLLLAKRLMQVNGYDGLFFGLPTMATANGMYTRVASFYQKLYAEGQTPSLVLAHGAKDLSDAFQQTIIETPEKMQEEISYDKGEEDSATANCLQWLTDTSKKSMLADIAVGTIDQSLLAILLSKFQSLRMYGLMQKVIILDEIHAYDEYMNVLIETLIECQARIGASIILLSATIPNKLKSQFVAAFQKGREQQAKPLQSQQFPLITVCNTEIQEIHVDTREEVKREVAVQFLHTIADAEKILAKAKKEKQCVCWIRNTVSDAIETYEKLQSIYGEENVILFHARFAMGDRLAIEENVLKEFGKDSNETTRAGKILIATQVVEQSLDLDFDYMITDLAPIDLIIQRAGRLHRHTRDTKGNKIGTTDQRQKPILHIISPAMGAEPTKTWYSSLFRGGSIVYPDHGKLYQTAKVLMQKGCIKMPEDARELIEFVYGSGEPIPSALQAISQKNKEKFKQTRAVAKNNHIKIKEGYSTLDDILWNDTNAPTRLGEETVQVVLAKYDKGRLYPSYNKGKHSWANSQVKAMSYLIAEEREVKKSPLREEIARVREFLPKKGKYSLLLPITKAEGGEWTGTALDKDKNEIVYTYNPKIGFRRLETGKNK
ncbi:MAG: CRISPR-associated helicase Cas3' [Spirochaetota bacterium]